MYLLILASSTRFCRPVLRRRKGCLGFEASADAEARRSPTPMLNAMPPAPPPIGCSAQLIQGIALS